MLSYLSYGPVQFIYINCLLQALGHRQVEADFANKIQEEVNALADHE